MLAVRNWFGRPILVALLIGAFVVQPFGPDAILPPPPAAFAQTVPIPFLSQWASNMLTYGSQLCTLLSNDLANPSLTINQTLNDVY